MVTITLSDREFDVISGSLMERAQSLVLPIPWLKDLPDAATKDHVIKEFEKDRKEVLMLHLQLLEERRKFAQPSRD